MRLHILWSKFENPASFVNLPPEDQTGGRVGCSGGQKMPSRASGGGGGG